MGKDIEALESLAIMGAVGLAMQDDRPPLERKFRGTKGHKKRNDKAKRKRSIQKKSRARNRR